MKAYQIAALIACLLATWSPLKSYGYGDASPTLTPLYGINPQGYRVWTFENVPAALGGSTVTVTIFACADLNESNEWVRTRALLGKDFGNLFTNSSATGCVGGCDSVQLSMTANEWNTARDSGASGGVGDVKFTFTPSSSVTNICCNDTCSSSGPGGSSECCVNQCSPIPCLLGSIKVTISYAEAECTVNAECDDGILCTVDTCESGTCVNTPIPSSQVTYVDENVFGGLGDGSTWANAYVDLQDALNTACGDIWVAAGTYEPTAGTDRSATFAMRDGVRVFGGFSGTETHLKDRNWAANVTTLSGDLNDDGQHSGNSYHVVSAIDTDETAVLDGFTVTMGNGDNSASPFDKYRGGGIHCDGCNSVFRNCVVDDNRAGVGAGMMIWQPGAGSADPEVVNCLFISNTASGFSGSAGGGIYSQAYNSGHSVPEITNCTFSSNSATLGGGGWSTDRGTNGTGVPVLTNCVFWGNTGGGSVEQQQILDQTPSLVESDLAYSCIEGCSKPGFCPPGSSNIAGNPLFRDPANGNYQLDIFSPCIDAGDNFAVPLDVDDIDGDGSTGEGIPFDLDGYPRRLDDLLTPDTGNGTAPIVDMGAYESPSLCVTAADCGQAPDCLEWTCDSESICVLGFSPPSTACGDPISTDCNLPDTCDGSGSCLPNFLAVDSPCGDSGATDCDNPDTCNGIGTCLPNYVDAGTVCGEPAVVECDSADLCNGFGTCVEVFANEGVDCGNPTDTDCDDPDTCDGAGTCLDNFEPIDFACGSPANTECDDPDSCDGAGSCRDNFEVFGVGCGDPTSADCDDPDTCDGAGLCLDNVESDGTPCPNGVFCDGDETCLVGVCVDNADPCIDAPHCDEAAGVCLECLNVNECADIDSDGITDDVCTWWECDLGVCNDTATLYPSNMGGEWGACPPDSFCNVHDRDHAFTCFAGTNGCDDINIDAGGAFGACPPDGFCNIHDANHALTCFAGTNSCECAPPGGAAPGGGGGPGIGPTTVAATALSVQPVQLATASDVVRVRIFAASALADIQGYQLDPIVSGGTGGQLELLDITIEPRADFVFAGRTDTFEAFNLTNGQMLCGLDGDGVATTGPAYLATYTYRVPLTAAGDFVMDIRRDEAAGDQTFLIASGNGRIEVSATTPGVISAVPAVIP